MIRTSRPAAVLLATTALAMGLSACKPDHRAEPVAVAGAPPIGPLDPGAAPATYEPMPAAPAPQDGAPVPAYAYPQRAYAMSRVADQRPPSYAFGYGDEQPWVWDDGADGTMFAEPIADGYRYYYYEPDADYPYFVQDPDYGYAYGPGGALVGLFGVTGALIAADHWRDHGPRAESYWSRGYDLDRVYRHGSRRPVQPAIWRAQAPAFHAGHDRWFHAAQAQPAWRQASAWGQAPQHDNSHDNGHRPGWFNDRGGYRGGRQVASAEPANPRVHPQPVHIETGQPRHQQAWRQARQDRPAARTPGPQWRGQPQPHPQQRPQPGGGHGGWNHGPAGSSFAHAAPQPRGGGPHSGWNHGGGQAFAHAAPQPHGGGGQHGGWNHGGNQGGGNHGGQAHAAQSHGANAGPHGGGHASGGGGQAHGGGAHGHDR